jgi:hypothetical protein
VTTDSASRGRLTWRFSGALMVLNSTEFHGETPDADLARRKSGVQIPSPPPHNPAGQSVAEPPSVALSSFPGPPGATLGPWPACPRSRTAVRSGVGRRRRARPGGRGARCRPPGTGGRSGGIWPDGAGMPNLQPQAPHQPTRHPSWQRPAVLIDGRFRWLQGLPLRPRLVPISERHRAPRAKP